MNENKFESLSALLDNDNVEQALLDEVSHDDKLSETWSRYHLIGDIMRGDSSDFIDRDLSENIAVAIAAEPTVLAPIARPTVTQRVKAKVIQMSRPVGQFAIAASAAGLMVLGVQQANISDEGQVVPTQVWQPLPMGGIADPVSYNYSTQSLPTQKQSTVERHQRLQALLADHNMQIKLQSQVESERAEELAETQPE
ncbi:RseA family anti-sigma factor [Thalassotalea psychrophila]|uniref:Anti-sigma-E factor RseA n=1 Tax=Thalassotalea psychrophila TaxID=3065647 RepID=A0ABY9TRN6_9GAMM|nr:RseA family anti-sigma factor [Colwelliaceae bacterium SQ149]